MRAVLLSALVVSAAATAVPAKSLWGSWKVAHKRSYASAVEEATRFAHFEQNYAQIQELNHRHAHKANSARFQLNKFADHSPSELQGLRMTQVPANARQAMPVAAPTAAAAPAAYDWRSTDGGIYVAPIQDQGQCGSCWAFSATANMESRFAIARKTQYVKLAEQALVDCDQTCGTYGSESGCDAGCNGGLMPNAFQYVKTNGQPGENAYPYTGVDGSCGTKGLVSRVNISSYELLSQSEDAIAAYLAANGPVSVAVDASEWSFYIGGIMEYLCWGTTTLDDLDHGVVIVGYGTDGSTPYWIIRNSWASDWGESGYARILRGQSFCGVNLFASSSVV